MAIPDYQSIMLPMLQFLGDGKERHRRDVVEYLVNQFQLTEEERFSRLPSGSQRVIDNRTDWASTHLVKAGLLERPRPGYLQITDPGKGALSQQPQNIDRSFLQQFEEYRSGWGNSDPPPKSSVTVIPEDTPEVRIDKSFGEIRQALADELLERVKRCDPRFFEELVVDLLEKMGYGKSRNEGPHRKQSGDEGIDGIIDQDALGLDTIYLQAKRWGGNVGSPEIYKFAGALLGQKARKGVFITTSSFTTDAKDYASKIDATIVLIDGAELAQRMIDHDVGVTPKETYVVKGIDSNYFRDQPVQAET